MAVNDDKTKLIGLLYYQFTTDSFVSQHRSCLRFQRSIDTKAQVCLSTELLELAGVEDSRGAFGEHGQGQATQLQEHAGGRPSSAHEKQKETYKNVRKYHKGAGGVRDGDFSKADNMGLETGDGEDDDVEESHHSAGEAPQRIKSRRGSAEGERGPGQKMHGSSKKPSQMLGINAIQTSTAKMRMPVASKLPGASGSANQTPALHPNLGSNSNHVSYSNSTAKYRDEDESLRERQNRSQQISRSAQQADEEDAQGFD